MLLVTKVLFQTGSFISKKPSITNYPAYVPVMVEDYPAAKSPTPQMILDALPKVASKAIAAVERLSSRVGS